MNPEIGRRRGWIIMILCAVVAFVAPDLHAQPTESSAADSAAVRQSVRNSDAADSVRLDSLHYHSLHPDSLALDTAAASFPGSDSVGTATTSSGRPFDTLQPPLGSLGERRVRPGIELVTDRDLDWMRYRTAFDVLVPLLPAFPVSEGSAGLYRSFSYAGASPGAIATLYDGRPLPGETATGYHIEDYPMEFMSRLEILRGVQSIVFGTGASLVALNFVQPEFDVRGSYARIFYAQSDYNLADGDLTYSRNITSRTNLTIGFRRLTSDGLYDNQDLSNTTLRASMRWNPVGGLGISATELYTISTRGLSGGLTSTSSTNPLGENVVDPFLGERRVRHDATLAAQWMPQSSEGDSTAGAVSPERLRIDGTLYYTNDRREVGDTAIPTSQTGTFGARAEFRLPLGGPRLIGNGILEARHFESDSASATGRDPLFTHVGALVEVPLGSVVLLRGGGRFEAGGLPFRSGSSAAIAGELAVLPTDSVSASVGGRVYVTDAAASDDSVESAIDIPTRALAEASIDWRFTRGRVRLDGYYRAVDRGVAPAARIGSIYGGGLDVEVPLWWILSFRNHTIVTVAPADDGRFPLLTTTGDLWAASSSFDDNLDWRLGLTLEWQTSMRGSVYDPETDDIALVNDGIPATTFYPDLTAYAQARIGSAYLRAAIENILGSEYWSMYRYPIATRRIVLQVTWSLID